MKKYLKTVMAFNNYYEAFNEDNLTELGFCKSGDVSFGNSFNDKEEMREIVASKISDGSKIISRKEFLEAFIDFNKRLNNILKEL